MWCLWERLKSKDGFVLNVEGEESQDRYLGEGHQVVRGKGEVNSVSSREKSGES